MLNFVNKLFGSSSHRMLKKYSSTIDKINDLENTISNLSDQELRDKTSHFKNLLSEGKSPDDILPEAFEETNGLLRYKNLPPNASTQGNEFFIHPLELERYKIERMIRKNPNMKVLIGNAKRHANSD